MTPATSKTAPSLWQAPGHALTIEYSHRLLEDILIQVVDGFESYLSGGCETGGVLFGEHVGGLVRLVARRPLELTPPRPSYILGEEDERRLVQLLEEARRDPELKHLEPVGWYHSHTRSEVFLSEADLEIYDRYFPEPWQVALVARPAYGEPVRAGFFFREPDGYIRSDASYNEFAVAMPERGGRLRQAPPWPQPETELAAATRVVEEGHDASELPPPPDRDRWWRWALPLAGIVFFLALSALATWRYWNNLPVPSVGLNVEARAGWLEISWNGDHQALRLAGGGLLSIRDGEKQASRRLTPDELRQSRARYQPSGERVEVRLEAPYLWVHTIRESVTWLAHPGWDQPAPQTLAARAERDQARAEQETVQGDLDRQMEEIRALETRIQELSAPPKPSPKPFAGIPAPRPTERARELPPAPTLSARATPAAPAASPQIVVPPPAPPAVRPAAPVAAAPQTIVPPPAARPSTAPATPSQAAPAASAPAPVAPAAPPRPSAPPARGKFLWTGMLNKGQTLVIEGNRASTGYVSGELPGTAVRLGAFPADLSADGLRVASPNPRFAGAGAVSEPAAAHNGWNATRYVFDARAMRDVLVLESPAGPGSKRVVVRAGTRKLTAILFEWESVAQ